MIICIWTAVIAMIIVLYLRKTYTLFSKAGVNHLPYIPPFGNVWKTTFRITHFSNILDELCTKFPKDRFVGFYETVSPVIILKDIDLIKQITVKDFDSFLDHRMNISEDSDPIFGNNLFALKGQKWKDMRSTLSPAFTSSKIRLMVPFMVDVGNQMIASLKKKFNELGTDSMDIDMKDLTTRYSNDVIATCAFGIKVDSMAEENNNFYKMGKIASNFTFVQILKLFGFNSLPLIMAKLKISLFTEDVKEFFTQIVLETMRNREKNNIVRPDMINLLMEAKKGNLNYDNKMSQDEDAGFATVEESVVGKTIVNREWSDNDLIAQAVLFFIAGFDGVASVTTFLLYELALNPDCQNKLLKEIREVEKLSDQFDYNIVQKMKYLDMLVSEVLRKWPAGIVTDRVATRSYNLGKPNNQATQDYIIKKGECLFIPTWSIHRNPEYYENPSKFDPERFSDENKHKIKPFTYLPFGAGPRNCVGSRFALCEVKVMVYQIIQHMEVLPCEKTCIPAVLSPESFNLRLLGGHWLKIRSRN